jgi:FkbM family methyltransferase
MLISFNDIVKKYSTPKGIIHIGAHLLEERGDYLRNGVNNIIWIEANPFIFSKIENTSNNIGFEKCYNLTISDEDGKEYKFNITNNGQSSSILELEKHKIHHPHIFVSEIITTNATRMDTFLNNENIDLEKFNFLNLDIQGAELLALKSFGELIKNFKFIYTEVNTASLYKNCAKIEEIDEYLSKFRFKRIETKMTDYEWGDALYING